MMAPGFLGSPSITPLSKPPLVVDLDFSLAEGEAVCFDVSGRNLGRITKAQRPPAGTYRVALSPEDYFPLMRSVGLF